MSFLSSQIYYVNSTNRLSGTNGHFSYQIQLPPNCDFDHVCLLAANVPISYYMVPTGYNTFVLTERKSGVDTLTTITIPIGNYTVNSFKTVLATLLNAASPNHWTYAITFPNAYTSVQTGKFTYTVTGQLTGDYSSFTFTNALNELMGFVENSTNQIIGSLVSTNVISFVPETNIIIHSDICADGRSDILGEIFNNNSVPLSNACYQCPDVSGYSKPFRTLTSNVYSFSLTDEHGRNLDLNGLNCVFTLILFKQDNLTNIIRNYLKVTMDSNI
jgi:hypothetical protein